MSFSSGTFSLVAGNPVVTATTISSTVMNNTLSDIATGLTTCILKDGTQTCTAAIPFAEGITIPTGKSVVGAGTAAISGFALIGATMFNGPIGGTGATPAAATVTTLAASSEITSSGTIAAYAANKLSMSHLSGASTIATFGPNASTNGTLNLATYRSDGTNAIIALAMSAAGAITLSSLAGSGSRTVVADANGLLSAP